ncbi:coproporphyrinogen dehydrogenase HemZ [Butyrivibrio sp. YAB3001]|uniref:coproporphyrinogen dehydrogenase HemZ n=1 Tax=Butyrivibrio sp. YAB3001 TaxID=1520812 RepID=UPI0008F68DCF|nr:coproporphyrinogen dehydrogenase HemZ [Butyrivibrio sp. YAB3001]SFB66633.1 oxygen-independent coproporphyrinogen-3 oxidase [Butyrivibrio sp. YAB3001]
MKKILVNTDKHQYDIHSLFKAFLGNEDVKVITEPNDDESFYAVIEIKSVNKSDLSDEGNVTVRLEDGTESEYKYLDEFNNGQSSISTNGEKADKPDTSKNAVKKAIYTALCKSTGKELPWGNLTGIRPTRIAMNLIDKGQSDEEIAQYMKDTYFVSDEKIKLSTFIARREKEILKNIDYLNGYSLYIGIPFCPTTCLYCSFTSYPIGAHKNIVDDYISCLEKEIDYVAENFKGKTLDTIYVGGGTPTTLEPHQIERLLGYVRDKLDISGVKELTVESGRPDSITREKLAAMKKMGVSRISVNPQTMRDETLKLIGRRHTVSQLIDSFNMAREEGFDNINMDIILGLPGETADDVRYTMEEIRKLSPDDLTVHSLAIKRGSKLYEVIHEKEMKGELKVPLFESINNTEEMMRIAYDGALEMGLEPYYLYRQKNISGNFENTGYARKGKAGIYNILINEEVQSIVALGAGTVTKRVFGGGRIERCDNVKDVALYMNNIDEMIERKKILFNL